MFGTMKCPEDGLEVRQLHFDTDKLNKFLHKKCFERGISVHVDEIKYVHVGEGIEYVEGNKDIMLMYSLIVRDSEDF